MLINVLEGGGGSYLNLGLINVLERRVLLESGCSLTFWRGEEGLT